MAIISKKHLVFFSILCIGTAMLSMTNIAHADSDNTITLAVKSATTDGKAFDGMWIEIKEGSNVVHSGLTPLSYNATLGTVYTVYVSDYENIIFQNWNDGSKDYAKSITPITDITLVAHYTDKAADASKAIPEQSPQTPNTAEPPLLPDWLRNVASSWLSGQLNDKEFIVYLQRLVDQKILTLPVSEKETQKQEGFSNTQCKKGDRYVEMVGKYTNGDKPYGIVSLRMVLLDSDGEILASGSGTISNIGVHESRYFNVITRYHMEFASCEIQVENVLPLSDSK